MIAKMTQKTRLELTIRSFYQSRILLTFFHFQGLIIIGGEDETHPSKVRLFKNRPNMTFDQATTKGMHIYQCCNSRLTSISIITIIITNLKCYLFFSWPRIWFSERRTRQSWVQYKSCYLFVSTSFKPSFSE